VLIRHTVRIISASKIEPGAKTAVGFGVRIDQTRWLRNVACWLWLLGFVYFFFSEHVPDKQFFSKQYAKVKTMEVDMDIWKTSSDTYGGRQGKQCSSPAHRPRSSRSAAVTTR
jgi:hypothetical protein